jgi:cell division septation protein DedD
MAGMRALWPEPARRDAGINPHAACQNRGMPAPSQPAAIAPESATTALYRAALGPVNTAHYLAIFARFDDAGRASPMWNAPAGLLTLNWMVFRQLWGAALVYVACAEGLALLVLGLGRRFLQWPQAVEWGVLGALLLLSIAIPGAYGNAILHADTRRRMTRAVRAASTVREACAALDQQASSRRRLWGLAAINVLLAAGAVGGYLALTQRGPAPAAEVAVTPVQVSPATVPAEPAPAAQAATVAATVELPPLAEPLPALEPTPAVVPPPVLSAPEPTVVAAPPAPPPTAEPAAVAAPKPKPAPARAAAAREPADAVPQAHGINVGLFADPANAERAHARLIEAGLPAILQKVDSPKGERTRVRVGPFAGRAQAEAAAARIRAMGLDAVVFAP